MAGNYKSLQGAINVSTQRVQKGMGLPQKETALESFQIKALSYPDLRYQITCIALAVSMALRLTSASSKVVNLPSS